MEWLNTWRNVPPIPLQSWARVTVVFSVFLAAQDYPVPHNLEPFALAIGVDLLIRILQFLTGRMNFFEDRSDDYLIVAAFCCASITLASWVVFQTALIAMIILALWSAMSVLSTFGLSFMPEEIKRSNSIWRGYGDDAPFAMRLEAFCHLIKIILFAGIFLTMGSMIALAYATFGILIMAFIINWTIYVIIRSRYVH